MLIADRVMVVVLIGTMAGVACFSCVVYAYLHRMQLSTASTKKFYTLEKKATKMLRPLNTTTSEIGLSFGIGD